jgi:hypothetical protein
MSLMDRIQKTLEAGLYHRRGLVRKGSALLLRGPKRWSQVRATPDEYLRRPPVLANSFPKSGTHLLDQIVAGLPDRVNYGSFLSSLTSSFQLRQRSDRSVIRYIDGCAPAENVRAHLFYDARFAEQLEWLNFVHYFIYRDPRDVIVSGCHYLREMNPWHRLGKHFRACGTMEDAILLSIRGLSPSESSDWLPNVGQRFALYEGWLQSPEVCAFRFEDLRGAKQAEELERLVRHFASRCAEPPAVSESVDRVAASIKPEKSHTFRKGRGGGWVAEFTPACKDAFKQVAGELLIRLGYEHDNNW